MTHSHCIRFIIAICCLAILSLPLLITGCGDAGDDADHGITTPVLDTSPNENNENPDIANNPQNPPDENDENPDIVENPQDPQPNDDNQNPDLVEQPQDPFEGEPAVSFKNDIQPILNATCAVPGCHVGNRPDGGLNQETYDNFKNGGRTGPAFIPGDGRNSLVVRKIDGGGMPRRRPPLNRDQIQLFIDWIDAGAEDN